MLDHERLDSYQCALQLTALCYPIIGRLPKGNAHLADQLRRAAISIPLNIAEGVGRTSPRERRRFYSIARGSAMECAAILDLLRTLELSSDHSEAKALIARVVAMLSRMSR